MEYTSTSRLVEKVFQNSLFKLILDWRTDAHKGMAQEKLSANYETVVETFSPRTKGNKTNKTSQSSAETTRTQPQQQVIRVGQVVVPLNRRNHRETNSTPEEASGRDRTLYLLVAEVRSQNY
ncbi:hypothetical protein MHU86_21652 [Fragilaria crotonensis]|nr:hypothetical protein MHU86_21652 [Fragilaria crotonensis]